MSDIGAALQDIEDQLRSALLQIGKSSAHLPSRQGCTFGLHVQAQEGESVSDGGKDHEVRRNDFHGVGGFPVT